MNIEELVRSTAVQTAPNQFVYGVHGATELPLARLVATVPERLMARLGRTACYFVPGLLKQRRAIAILAEPAAEADSRHELCHYLDLKPDAKLLLISTSFYRDDNYGLAMEFFDKVAYIAALETSPRSDFHELLDRQMVAGAGGELTPETWEWRTALQAQIEAGQVDEETRLSYRRAAEADSLGIYMAALFTDVFYEDLFEKNAEFPPLPPEQLAERVRALDRLFPPNRGYGLQLVRQRPKRRV